MLCKIADLFTEVPEAGGMSPRCQEYLWPSVKDPDIIIREQMFRPNAWASCSPESRVYLETGTLFYAQLLLYNGLMLHSSAVAMNGHAYLFSGPCGTGKSTHTHMWQQVFGDAAQVFNDDKPALRLIDGRWYAYGTPWCGKDNINQNMKVPLGGICFLKQAPENKISRLTPQESVSYILSQTISKFYDIKLLDCLLSSVDKLVREIPVFLFENRPNPEAAQLSFDTMSQAAMELNHED